MAQDQNSKTKKNNYNFEFIEIEYCKNIKRQKKIIVKKITQQHQN